jgi:hypothetical protein
LNEDAKFSDGSAIAADDVIASIKRLIILRTSTHFPLWDYIDGCQNVKSLSDSCSGLKKISERKLEINLKVQVEDFQLQMASPETGIWKASDIDSNSKGLTIKPTAFSGPYSVEKVDSTGFLIKRNPYNPISKKFPNSPKLIQIKSMPADKVPSAMSSGTLDMMIRSRNPMDDVSYSALGYDSLSSAPATLIYLHGAGNKKRKLIGREFIRRLWGSNPDKMIQAADNFLPFDPNLSISKEEFLSTLPEKGAEKIKIGLPWTYLSKNFYDYIVEIAEKSGTKIETVSLIPQEWNSCFDSMNCPDGIDYVLGVYAASERYPAVQLRYITGNIRTPDVDLTGADAPELSDKKKKVLKDYQIALLDTQFAVPLFFARHQIHFKRTLDVGDQPPSDAEVELWRVTKK